jgi:hypothetical protein
MSAAMQEEGDASRAPSRGEAAADTDSISAGNADEQGF